ncbi:hypothetical protein XENOCAPTIV_012386 [Xenoophorus captivus]|uniref:Peptidase M1 membrane alanine aminopeptidase domain-containing protein n=1 Tax=Xenoophorus captivus TaxID=1517983 RepID=A0ABV0QHZ3_9TELE
MFRNKIQIYSCIRMGRRSWNVLSLLFSDLLAVPKHPYAAMENWGLSVFVEHKILLDAEVSSLPYQMELTMVVVHEICHQVGKGLLVSRVGDESSDEVKPLLQAISTVIIMFSAQTKRFFL